MNGDGDLPPNHTVDMYTAPYYGSSGGAEDFLCVIITEH